MIDCLVMGYCFVCMQSKRLNLLGFAAVSDRVSGSMSFEEALVLHLACTSQELKANLALKFSTPSGRLVLQLWPSCSG